LSDLRSSVGGQVLAAALGTELGVDLVEVVRRDVLFLDGPVHQRPQGDEGVVAAQARVLTAAEVALDDLGLDAADRPGFAGQPEATAAGQVVAGLAGGSVGVGGEVEAHEPMQFVEEVRVHGAAGVGFKKPLDDNGERRVGGGLRSEELRFFPESQEFLLGLQFRVGVFGAADEGTVTAAEVGAPGAVGVPGLGWTGHGRLL
jgi:hypothetical protein